MLNFANDYAEGAHEAILRRLEETNREALPGYGEDRHTAAAKERIRLACAAPGAEIFLLVGGTQTNLVAISSLLRGWEGVLAAASGHINEHEAGAIEGSGHKVIALPQREGKLRAADLAAYLEAFHADEARAHRVFPGMVYLSQPTEYGTLYSRAELSAIAALCRRFGLRLYVDGARLAYALASRENDLSLPELAQLCDLFYIGGTKVGALCGEALVFPRGDAPQHMTTLIKRQGALPAKGRLLGVQFDVLFSAGLYFELGRHAVAMADRLREGLRAKGLPFYIETSTNLIFIELAEARCAALREALVLSLWERLAGDRVVVRLATSWATRAEEVEALLALL